MDLASKPCCLLTILYGTVVLQASALNVTRVHTTGRDQVNKQPKVMPGRNYGNLPLAFEPNVGQADAPVRFIARGIGITAFFTDSEIALVLGRAQAPNDSDVFSRKRIPLGKFDHAVIWMELKNVRRPRREVGLEKLPGISNYFIGNDPTRWRTHVPQYARIRYEGVYKGIDLEWYSRQGQLEFDFVVSPGADPKQIQLAYEGAGPLLSGADGGLILRTPLGEMRSEKPLVYQLIQGRRLKVKGDYARLGRNRVSFEIAGYDRRRELRIDPLVLTYSTYFGGSGNDYCSAIAIDKAGSAYVTGNTDSANFPVQSTYQKAYGGVGDAFVAKLTPDGTALIYSTYLGGRNGDSGSAIAVDELGAAYITGSTASFDFPLQSPFQATLEGNNSSAFVAKLSSDGDALLYSTFLGGDDASAGTAIGVDTTKSVYVTGYTFATNFPVRSAFQPKLLGKTNAFVTKFSPRGDALIYSTYLGGSVQDAGDGIALDANGAAYVTGNTTSLDFPTAAPFQAHGSSLGNAFVTKFAPEGNALVYSTYLGGAGQDWGYGIAVDTQGSAYVTGLSRSPDFPTHSPFEGKFQGPEEAFVTKLAPAGNALVYSTYLGGGQDEGRAIAVDKAGSAYVAGFTSSPRFPTLLPYQAALRGVQNAFIIELTPTGNSLVYSTYLGGSGDGIGNGDNGAGIAVDSAGAVYVTGFTTSSDFPTRMAFDATLQSHYDGFVSKLALINTTVSYIGSSATGTSRFAAGQLVSIYGNQLGPSAGSGLQLGPGGVVTTLNGGTRVLFDGTPAPILYASAGQVNTVIPCEVAGHSSTQVVVEYMGVQSTPVTVPLGPAAPGIFTVDGSGQGQAAALNQDNSFNGLSNPAPRGSVVTFYATGVGPTSPCTDGATYPSDFPTLTLPIIVGVGNGGAHVQYSGQAPDLVSGVAQFNVVIPTSAPTGVVPLTLVVGGVFGRPGVTIAIK